MRLLAAALLLLISLPADAFEISLLLGSARHPAFTAERIEMRQEADGTLFAIGALQVAGRQFVDLRLKCRDFSWADGELSCRGGALKVGAGIMKSPEGVTASLDIFYVSGRDSLDVFLRDVPAASLAGLLPELSTWHLKGKVSGKFRLVGNKAEFDLKTDGLAYGNAAGTQAGEGIALHVAGTALNLNGAWQWQARTEWSGGEIYAQPWYAKGAGQALRANGALDASAVQIDAARVTLPGIGNLDGTLRWNRLRGALTALSLSSDALQVAPAWALLGQPLLGETPRVLPQGTVRFSLSQDGAGLRSLDLDLNLVSLDLAEGRLALAGLRANVPWRRDAAMQAKIVVAGGKAGELAFGAFAVPLAMDGWRFGFDKVELPLLDSRLLFENFAARREGGEWNWQLGMALHPADMAALTRALHLPIMRGLLSATLPRMRYADRTLSLDGTMVISVFDGFLAVEGFRVIEPFGRAPRVLADATARHLDLALLTNTFSFGNITGYVDADVHGLEMAGWQPAAFDARVVTSAGDFGKRISRRAVRNISALGGGASAGAAVEASVVGFFDTFGYERLGLSCLLLAGVCQMGGLKDTAQGYLIVQGGGLPALNVIGYNRRVGWDVLVSRLRDVAAGNSKPVIE